MNKKVLITGSRYYTDVETIAAWLAKLQDWGYDTLIEGESKGVDFIARFEANRMGFLIMPFPAKWSEYRRKYPIKEFGMKWKSAGTDRNTQMLMEGKPGLVVAFHKNIKESKGTKNMIKQAEKAGIETILVDD